MFSGGDVRVTHLITSTRKRKARILAGRPKAGAGCEAMPPPPGLLYVCAFDRGPRSNLKRPSPQWQYVVECYAFSVVFSHSKACPIFDGHMPDQTCYPSASMHFRLFSYLGPSSPGVDPRERSFHSSDPVP